VVLGVSLAATSLTAGCGGDAGQAELATKRHSIPGLSIRAPRSWHVVTRKPALLLLGDPEHMDGDGHYFVTVMLAADKGQTSEESQAWTLREFVRQTREDLHWNDAVANLRGEYVRIPAGRAYRLEFTESGFDVANPTQEIVLEKTRHLLVERGVGYILSMAVTRPPPPGHTDVFVRIVKSLRLTHHSR
jgi:hypothetical protein